MDCHAGHDSKNLFWEGPSMDKVCEVAKIAGCGLKDYLVIWLPGHPIRDIQSEKPRIQEDKVVQKPKTTKRQGREKA